MNEKAFKGCEVLLFTCAGAKPDDKVLVITDNKSFEIGKIMYDCASRSNETTLSTRDG